MKISGPYNLFKKIFSVGAIREGGRNPFVDWALILIISFIICLILVINSIYLLKRVNEGDIQSKNLSISTSTEAFDSKGLDSIIDKFNSKEILNAEIRKNYQIIPDPSI